MVISIRDRACPFILGALALVLASCGDAQSPPPVASHDEFPHLTGEPAVVILGTISLRDQTFVVSRLSPCIPDEGVVLAETQLSGQFQEGASRAIWLEDADGSPISRPTTGDIHESGFGFGRQRLVFTLPEAGASLPHRVVLELREEGSEESGSLPLYGGAQPAHGGIVAPLAEDSGDIRGWVELKHRCLTPWTRSSAATAAAGDGDDTLELWLAVDGAMREPLDLPVETVVKAVGQDQALELRAGSRVGQHNADGEAVLRDGRTNYFVLPAEPGRESSALRIWVATTAITVIVPLGGKELQAGPFFQHVVPQYER